MVMAGCSALRIQVYLGAFLCQLVTCQFGQGRFRTCVALSHRCLLRVQLLCLGSVVKSIVGDMNVCCDHERRSLDHWLRVNIGVVKHLLRYEAEQFLSTSVSPLSRCPFYAPSLHFPFRHGISSPLSNLKIFSRCRQKRKSITPTARGIMPMLPVSRQNTGSARASVSDPTET